MAQRNMPHPTAHRMLVFMAASKYRYTLFLLLFSIACICFAACCLAANIAGSRIQPYVAFSIPGLDTVDFLYWVQFSYQPACRQYWRSDTAYRRLQAKHGGVKPHACRVIPSRLPVSCLCRSARYHRQPSSRRNTVLFALIISLAGT